MRLHFLDQYRERRQGRIIWLQQADW